MLLPHCVLLVLSAGVTVVAWETSSASIFSTGTNMFEMVNSPIDKNSPIIANMD